MSKLCAAKKPKTKTVTFELFHSVDDRFWEYLRYGRDNVNAAFIREGFRSGDYIQVGTFKRPAFPAKELHDELERLFYITNHINGEWDGTRRCTSVGDVIKHGKNYYIVAPVGFDFAWNER